MSLLQKKIIIHKYALPSENRNYQECSLKQQPYQKQPIIDSSEFPPSKIHNSRKCNRQRKTFNTNYLKDLIKYDQSSDHLKKHIMFQQQKQSGKYNQTKKRTFTRAKTLQKTQNPIKIKKFFLPSLKHFDDLHFQTDRIPQTQKESTYLEKNLLHSISRHQNDNHMIQPPFLLSLSKKQATAHKKIQKNYLSPNSPTKEKYSERKIYKYIENDVNNASTLGKKPPNKEQDEQHSIQSFSPTFQKEASVIFHNFKQKAIQQPLRDSSYLLSKPLFNIVQIRQKLNEFILSYTPLNPLFDLKEFIRDSEVQIRSNQKNIFAGRLVNQKIQGRGILITEKELFEGQFINGLKVSGIEKNRNGIYQGSYRNGRRNGTGKFIWSNGEIYEGEWFEGKKSGYGCWKSSKGDYYKGQWKQNLQNGKGLFQHKGCSIYRGYFKNSLKQGRGQEQLENGDKYQGEYQKGKPHGYGKYIWANGDTYQGDFVEGSRSGKGMLRKISGETYEGEFKEDMKEGYGKQKYVKGQYFEGYFEKNVKMSGTFFSRKGTALKSY